MHSINRFLLTTVALLCLCAGVRAEGWPANYQGVMLQGFYWDSYTDTNWRRLEANADEYSKYFSLIWVPNSAKAEGSRSMGYQPVYWFTNHNSSFGGEGQLRQMIQTYREKGTGIIADVVINHRAGVSNWTDFPTEVWNGKTYHIGTDGICRNDEVAGQAGQAQPTGAYDTGENWAAARDLDHTNANVQENCKAYINCLLNDFGYAGVRYDFVKGYAPQYTRMYNQANGVRFSVGEYWDGSYDAVKNWIDGTGRESAAFDFPFKYQVNKAFANNNMSELVWKANGTTDQPAGMIHFGYAQLAVTFIDNHDTYRDGNKFTGDVVAANAFMLFSPGTPCVFLPHYQTYKTQIQRLIEIRNACGIHNCSSVKVLKSGRDIYMAEIKGTKGSAVVRIGDAGDVPAGYTSADIKASGNKYCVWSKTGVTPDPDPDPDPTTDVTIYWDNTVARWTTPHIHYWGAAEPTYPGVAMEKVTGNVWKYVCPAGTTGCLFNAGDGDATKTADFVAIDRHIYTQGGDQGEYSDGPHPAADLYIIGYVDGHDFTNTDFGLTQSSATDNVYRWDAVTIGDAGAGLGYFNIASVLGHTGTPSDWDNYINTGIRYGATAKDAPLVVSTPADVRAYIPEVDCSACESWAVEPGKYAVTLDLNQMKISLTATSGISCIEAADSAPAVYYNLQGVRVDNPSGGLFIEVRGNQARKVIL